VNTQLTEAPLLDPPTDGPERSIRITWDDDTSVEVWFVTKGASKSTAQVQHRKLVSRDDANARKAYWGERLTALAAILEP